MPSEQEWKIDLMNWDAGDVPGLRSDDRKWTLQPGAGLTLQMPGVTENNNWYEHGFVPKNDTYQKANSKHFFMRYRNLQSDHVAQYKRRENRRDPF